MSGIEWAEQGLVPDFLIRRGIRNMLARRLDVEAAKGPEEINNLVAQLRESPVALNTQEANEQHYELPPEFFLRALGRRLKYSCCYWPEGVNDLDAAEDASVAQVAERAGIEDGMEVLELGCGWGSFTLYAAERFRGSRFLAVSNSAPQREFIMGRAKERGLTNVEVITADMNAFTAPGQYDRIVSIEMFEHMRNYAVLMKRIRGWLKPNGRLFVHIFTHQRYAYPYEVEENGKQDWLARYFFTGGIMPSDNLLLRFPEDMQIERHWIVNGHHYHRTCEAWLERQDAQRSEIMAIFEATYGKAEAKKWFNRWRLFFLACSELFNFRGGREWQVSHYRFKPAE